MVVDELVDVADVEVTGVEVGEDVEDGDVLDGKDVDGIEFGMENDPSKLELFMSGMSQPAIISARNGKINDFLFTFKFPFNDFKASSS
jgi:hypothetical protein